MPSLLQRFRRIVAPPGRPGEAVGVPASGTELEGELEPVLERLDDVDAEASEIEAQATAEAERRREDAARKAEAILAEARVAAEAERAGPQASCGPRQSTMDAIRARREQTTSRASCSPCAWPGRGACSTRWTRQAPGCRARSPARRARAVPHRPLAG